ncbi:hypothetical protein BKA65DRAFT_156073 [Rhexocercosporidium sp. MPI-PUGE-AT-0058]|nr:hypothetical protein BKA65DRAFT_156073 [Rhexocercosporidium sp. MPI-PUGE-AT-0058]
MIELTGDSAINAKEASKTRKTSSVARNRSLARSMDPGLASKCVFCPFLAVKFIVGLVCSKLCFVLIFSASCPRIRYIALPFHVNCVSAPHLLQMLPPSLYHALNVPLVRVARCSSPSSHPYSWSIPTCMGTREICSTSWSPPFVRGVRRCHVRRYAFVILVGLACLSTHCRCDVGHGAESEGSEKGRERVQSRSQSDSVNKGRKFGKH